MRIHDRFRYLFSDDDLMVFESTRANGPGKRAVEVLNMAAKELAILEERQRIALDALQGADNERHHIHEQERVRILRAAKEALNGMIDDGVLASVGLQRANGTWIDVNFPDNAPPIISVAGEQISAPSLVYELTQLVDSWKARQEAGEGAKEEGDGG